MKKLSTILSVILVLTMDDGLTGRILGHTVPVFFIGAVLLVMLFRDGKKIDPSCWKFALKISIPYIPHRLSLSVLHASNKVMITKMFGAATNALYSVAYTVSHMAVFLITSLNMAFSPWLAEKVAENDRVRKRRELDALVARDKELDALFERLYEDNVNGKIDDARFAKMSKRYEEEQGENSKKIKALRLELKKADGKKMDMDFFLETIRRYTDATTITRRMVGELIDHIDVYHAEKRDGVTNQRVVIHYNCIGAFDVPDRRKIPEADIIMETRKGVALSYAPAQIAV